MDIEVFAEAIRDSVKERLGKDYQVTLCKINKNNGVAYIGLNIKKDGQNVTPIVYLNEHFHQYKNGNAKISQIADYLVRSVRTENLNVDINKFLNYESVRKNVVYRVINTERNRELLEDLPHIEYMDLSIVFRVLVSQEYLGVASILIHNAHMKLWDVTVEDLNKDAEENTQKLERYELKSMKNVLCEIMETEDPDGYGRDECREQFSEDIPMYVLSNKRRIEGASCMLYPDVIKNFSDAVDRDLYIIPSSIHELLLLPTRNTDDGGEIKKMIKDINDTQVEPEEVLSYSLYYYNRKEDKISML